MYSPLGRYWGTLSDMNHTLDLVLVLDPSRGLYHYAYGGTPSLSLVEILYGDAN